MINQGYVKVKIKELKEEKKKDILKEGINQLTARGR